MIEPAPSRDDVTAVVVTYHPDPEAILRLPGWATQFGRLIVVDNHSGEAAASLQTLARQRDVILIRNQENRGIAAALNQGCRLALEHGARWVATFDQDSVPALDWLARVTAEWESQPQRESIGLIGANFRDCTGVTLVPPASGLADARAVITSGSLLTLAAWRDAGPFREDLFIDEVDHEYALRLRRRGWLVKINRTVLLQHTVGAMRRVDLFGWKLPLSQHSAQRRYYMARNRVLLAREYWRFDPAFVFRRLALSFAESAGVLLFETEKRAKLTATAKGLFAGIRGRVGRETAACAAPCLREPGISRVGGKAPRVTVALATYNGAAYLPAQLASIAAQNRTPDELVVCDDASQDETLSIVRDFARTARFPVRIEVNPQNTGSTETFARAIGLASGNIISLADQDDVWMPHKLSRILQELEANRSLGLVFSDATLIDDRGQPLPGKSLWNSLGLTGRERRRLRDGRTFEVLLRLNRATGATMAFRADFRDVVLPIPTGWVHDAWIALLIAAMAPAQAIAEPLIAYRQHARQQLGLRSRGIVQSIRQGPEVHAEEYDRIALSYRAAWERMAVVRDRVRMPNALDRLEQKVLHCRARAALNRQSGGRFTAVAGELIRGRYSRFSAGWRSVLRDLAWNDTA